MIFQINSKTLISLSVYLYDNGQNKIYIYKKKKPTKFQRYTGTSYRTRSRIGIRHSIRNRRFFFFRNQITVIFVKIYY